MIQTTSNQEIVQKTSQNLQKASDNKALQSIGELLHSSDIELIRLEIGKRIAVIIADLGIKTIPDSITQKRMIHYLLSYYQDLSMSDLSLAFELVLVGKIQADIEHYQSFDIKYLTRILNAYRNHRKVESLANERKAKPKALPSPKTTEKEQRESRIRFFRQLEQTYQKYEKTGVLEIYIYWLVYNRLIDYDIMQVSENQWNVWMHKAREQHKQRLQQPRNQNRKSEFQSILRNFEQAIHTYPFELSRIRNIAKEIAVKSFFKHLKTKKINLSTLLKKSGVYESQ